MANSGGISEKLRETQSNLSGTRGSVLAVDALFTSRNLSVELCEFLIGAKPERWKMHHLQKKPTEGAVFIGVNPALTGQIKVVDCPEDHESNAPKKEQFLPPP
jgi:hypothetical protein